MEDDILKVVVQKLQKINHLINEVTIGPNASSKVDKKSTLLINSTIKDSKKNNITVRDADSNIVSQMPTREFLKVLDLQRQEKLQNALNNRLFVFEQFDNVQKEQSREIWLKTKHELMKHVEKKESNILQATEQFDLKQSTQQALLAQHTQHALLRVKEKQEQFKEREKQRKTLLLKIDQIKSNQQKFYTEWQEVVNVLKSCENVNMLLKNSTNIDLNLLQTLPAEMGSIIEKCKTKSGNVLDISDEEVQKSENIIQKVIEFKNILKSVITEQAQSKDKAEISSSENKTSLQNQNSAQSTVTPVVKASHPISSAEPLGEKSIERTSNENANYSKLSKYVSISDLQLYVDTIEFLEKYKESFAQLEDDNALKIFRFNLKKAINIPVNSLSGVNSEHILDKYQKLHRLLMGQTVMVSDKEVNAARHPQGIAFCMDLLARKFILQGDLMVSANPESAFCYASVILSLWNDFPDFGKLLLGYFYKLCPCLVPYYIPRQVGESDEEFYIKLGYQYADGEVERQDKFLKRMTGILKLYFAILISKPKRSQATSPHNLRHGWKWLVSFLRLEPHLDITATALHVFLETVGFEMDNRYGKMFQKLLKTILQQFLPKCQKAQSTGGAVTRLELLLTEYLKTKKFVKPNGYVEYSVW